MKASLKPGLKHRITFKVTDTNAAIPVRYEGVLPDLFGEGEGVVATGRLVDGTFEATEILAKHDETYMPREVSKALKEQGEWRGDGAAPAPGWPLTTSCAAGSGTPSMPTAPPDRPVGLR